MFWTQLKLKTPIPNSPKIINDNFKTFERQISLFYDTSLGILTVPLETTGRVKATRGEFVTTVTDNLVVRNQFTNLYENYTTSDTDFVNAYNGIDTSTRVATDVSVWPYEPSTYSWIDIQTPQIKINNDVSYGLSSNNIGQEVRVILNTDVSTSSIYTILIDSSLGGEKVLTVTYANAPKTWLKLIMVAYDASNGPDWVVKEYGGDYTLV